MTKKHDTRMWHGRVATAQNPIKLCAGNPLLASPVMVRTISAVSVLPQTNEMGLFE